MPEYQTGKTLIRLLLQKQSDLGLHCLSRPFWHTTRVPQNIYSDFIWDFGKLPFPSHLGKYVVYIIKIGKISTKIHEIGKIKAIFGLGMTPV